MTELVALPITAGAVGALAETANLQAQKTIQVTGLTGTVLIEASADGGTTWCQVASFSGATEDQIVTVCADAMRVDATGGGADEVQVVAERGQIRSGVIPTPPASGPGASLITSDFGCLSTFIVANFSGRGSFAIEVSGDGVEWSTVASFQGNGCKTVNVSSRFVRANGNGSIGDITMASEEPAISALTSPTGDFVFSDTKPNGGNVYTDWEELLAAANELYSTTGAIPRIVFDVANFDAITIPAPAVPGTTYDVVNMIFHVPGFQNSVVIEDGVLWNGVPELSASRVCNWVFDVSAPVIDTSSPDHGAPQNANILVLNNGLHFFDNQGASEWWRITDDVFLAAVLPRSGGVGFFGAGTPHILVEALARFEVIFQGGVCEFNDNMLSGTGYVQIRNIDCARGASFQPENQPAYTGLYLYDPLFQQDARRYAEPLGDNTYGGEPIIRTDQVAVQGARHLFDDLEVSASLTYTAGTNIISGADFSKYHIGDSLVVSGTVSNNGTYTVAADGTGTEVEVVEALVNETVASVVRLPAITLTLPSTRGQAGSEISVHNFGTTNDVTVIPDAGVTIKNDPGPVPPGITARYEVIYSANALGFGFGSEVATVQAYCGSISA